MKTFSLEQTLKISVLEGGLTQIFFLWTTGSVLVGYMLHYGATPSQIALVASVPLLSQLFSPLAAWYASGLTQRRIIAALIVLIGRSLWLLAAFAPQLGVNPTVMPWFLLLVVGGSSLFQASVATIWSDWMGDIVSEKRRGRYFGRRMGIIGVIGMLANLGVGKFLDWAQAPLSFQLVLGFAVLVGICSAALLFFHFDPPKVKEQLALRKVFSLPFREPNFRKFLVFAGYFHIGIFLSAALIMVYFLQELQLSYSQLAIWAAIAATTGLITTDLWGRVADRIGNRTVMVIALIFMGIGFPTLWILADIRDNLNYLWLSAVVDAIAWGAGGPALFNLALVSAPKDKRLSYIAMFSFTTGLMGFIGGALAGPIYSFLNQFSFENWNGYHSIFVCAGFIRLSSILLLLRVKESKTDNRRPLLRHMRLGRRIGLPWR